MTSLKKTIELCEQSYKESIYKIAEEVVNNRNIRLILVAGPSCSGKTTTSSTISKFVYERAGIKSHTVSIDDFYKDVVFLPGETFADKNFEGLDSLDLDLLHSCLHDLSLGKTVDIPLFDFNRMCRYGNRSTITLGENEIAIVEGLHALNPAIYKDFVEMKRVRRVFLDCRDGDDNNKYERLIRRLVRDRNFRSADAYLTFTLWEKVIAGEEEYIYPYSGEADFKVNTFHNYETALLKPLATKLLDEIDKDNKYFEDALLVRAYLEGCRESISTDLVPNDSLLREFIG